VRKAHQTLARLFWIHLDRSHHSRVFVIENVAVKWEDAGDARIAKIQAQLHGGVRTGTIPSRQNYSVSPLWTRQLPAINLQKQKVDLMNVEGVDFAGVTRKRFQSV